MFQWVAKTGGGIMLHIHDSIESNINNRIKGDDQVESLWVYICVLFALTGTDTGSN